MKGADALTVTGWSRHFEALCRRVATCRLVSFGVRPQWGWASLPEPVYVIPHKIDSISEVE